MGQAVENPFKNAQEKGPAFPSGFLSGRHFYSCKKGGFKVGLTKKGKGSKIVLTTDETGFPLSETVESAQISEYRLALPTIDKINIPLRPVHGLRRPKKMVADRGYDASWLRTALRERNIKPVIPQRRKPHTNIVPKVNEKIKKDYAKRWIIERTFAWLNWFRRLDIRWERLPQVFEGFLKVPVF